MNTSIEYLVHKTDSNSSMELITEGTAGIELYMRQIRDNMGLLVENVEIIARSIRSLEDRLNQLEIRMDKKEQSAPKGVA